MLTVRMLIGGFQHDQWRRGRPFRREVLAESNLRLLEYGAVSLVYEIVEAEEVVEIVAILRNV